MILKKSKSNYVRTWFEKDGSLKPLFYEIQARFPIEDRQYYGGSWDGDGYHRNTFNKSGPSKTLKLTLEMAKDGCEPVLKLAQIFDLSIRYVDRASSGKEKYKNYQPTYSVDLAGPKAEMFLLFIYPYVVFRRPSIRKILLERGIPERLLKSYVTFSWPYLAGFADAEGTYTAYLRHEKVQRKKGMMISSSYKFCFRLPNTDFSSLDFIKNKIIEAGFEFRKDLVKHHPGEKVGPSILSRHGNPDNWNPCKIITLRGSPVELSRFYKNFYMYSLIKKKKDVMERTMSYSNIIFRDEA